MWFLGLAASAGVVAIVEVDGDTTRLVRAVQVDSPGRAADWAPIPRNDPRIRSFLGADGGEAVRLERATFRVRLPDGAVPADLPRAVEAAQRLHNDAPPAERLDLLVLAEGYTEAERAAFEADADALLAGLLATSPFDRHGDLLNVWRAFGPSAESGASKDTRFEQVTRDTALSCTYGCGGADRIICCDDDAVLAAADASLPEADAIFVLVNDDEYGGAGSFTYSVSFTGPDWIPVAVHELGHVLGELYDEYDYGFDAGAYGVNCAPLPPFLPWDAWLDEPGMGAWPGCTYSNLFRPTDSGCRMRELDGPFCPVCREALVRALHAHLPPLLEAPATAAPGEAVTVGSYAGTTVEWSVDGEPFATGATATLPTCGAVTVTATVGSEWVRSDPDGVMSASQRWDLGPCPRACDTAPGPSWLAVLLLPLARRR
ncbi:MAG: hypothetical protein H6737_01815 [Alphaproteobacteria bacterium]|nr:hypothetical protein [Alphaproteobacteria bacterium]